LGLLRENIRRSHPFARQVVDFDRSIGVDHEQVRYSGAFPIEQAKLLDRPLRRETEQRPARGVEERGCRVFVPHRPVELRKNIGNRQRLACAVVEEVSGFEAQGVARFLTRRGKIP